MLKFRRPYAIALVLATVALGTGIAGTALAHSTVKTSNASVKTFSYIDSSATPRTILNVDDLVIDASCAANTGFPVISATTHDAHADIFGHAVAGDNTVHAFGNDAFSNTSGPVDLTAGITGDPEASGTAVFERSNGDVVTITYGFDNPPTLGATNPNSATCTVFGSAIASSRQDQ